MNIYSVAEDEIPDISNLKVLVKEEIEIKHQAYEWEFSPQFKMQLISLRKIKENIEKKKEEDFKEMETQLDIIIKSLETNIKKKWDLNNKYANLGLKLEENIEYNNESYVFKYQDINKINFGEEDKTGTNTLLETKNNLIVDDKQYQIKQIQYKDKDEVLEYENPVKEFVKGVENLHSLLNSENFYEHRPWVRKDWRNRFAIRQKSITTFLKGVKDSEKESDDFEIKFLAKEPYNSFKKVIQGTDLLKLLKKYDSTREYTRIQEQIEKLKQLRNGDLKKYKTEGPIKEHIHKKYFNLYTNFIKQFKIEKEDRDHSYEIPTINQFKRKNDDKYVTKQEKIIYTKK
jgi:hypothetical protein